MTTVDLLGVHDAVSPLAVLFALDVRGSSRRRAPRRLRRGAAARHPRPRAAVAQRLDDVAQVPQQLAVLPPHDVPRATALNPARSKAAAISSATTSDAARVAADVEHAAQRRAVARDDARLEVRSRCHHHDAVHVGEAAQRTPLVLDAVLHARHRDPRWRGLDQRIERAFRVLALHREQHDVLIGPVDIAWVPDRPQRHHPRAVGHVDPQAVTLDRVEMRAAGDAHDVVAAHLHPRSEHAAHRSRAVDDELHSSLPSLNLASARIVSWNSSTVSAMISATGFTSSIRPAT